jgi:glycosyltransferase involved in cell wall biosynthesis
MNVLLYRRSLDLRSGAGQLLRMQLRGLEAAGASAVIVCDRGALRFWLRTGIRARRWGAAAMQRLRNHGWLLADHGLGVPSADLVFVHNLANEAHRHLPRSDLAAHVGREQAFFAQLDPTTLVVANSSLVRQLLVEHFRLPAERVTVLYPGFDAERFTRQRAASLRGAARRALGIGDTTPLVGFVTSGDFAKRGLDLFLDSAARMAVARPDAQFLVVGSKRLPVAAAEHPLVQSGRLHYRPKSRHPEPWFAALDLFLYTARFEEFGMVLAEAQAMGVPVLTSRRVGASECLPPAYAPWLLEQPDPQGFAALGVKMLNDAALRAKLATAAAATVTAFDQAAYVRGTLALLLAAQKRRLKYTLTPDKS